MTDFVVDNLTLPGPKVLWDGSSSDTAAPDMWCRHIDYNALRDAANSLRSFVKTGLTPGTYNLATLTVGPNGNITAISAGTGLTDGDKGDIVVSSSGTVFTIDTGVVSNAKLASMASLTIKANLTGSPAAPTDATVAAFIAAAGLHLAGLGDGRHGAAVFDGSTAVTGWTRSGSTYTQTQPTMFTTITVSGTVTCKPDGYPTYCQGDCHNDGIWDVSGGDASLTTPGAVPWTGTRPFPGGQAGGATGSNGGNSANNNTAPQDFSSAAANGGNGGASPTAGGTGGDGHGGGGGGGGGAGATSGGTGGPLSTMPSTSGWWSEEQCLRSGRNNLAATFTAGSPGGGGGNGSGGAQGGAGGASAGWAYLAAGSFSGSGSYRARGGAGGAGGAGSTTFGGGGGGGGGAGGIFGFRCAVGTTPAADVSGGAAGGGGAGGPSAGVAGAAGGPGGAGKFAVI